MKYIDLDFFQPERDRIALKRKKMIPLVIFAVVLIIMCLYIIYLQIIEKSLEDKALELSNRSLTVQNEITVLEDGINDIKSIIQRYENGANGQGSVSSENGALINSIQDEHLRAIMLSTPKEAFYSKILMHKNSLTLEGYTNSMPVVAKIVYNLEESGYFGNVLISEIVVSEDSGYQFTINADVKE